MIVKDKLIKEMNENTWRRFTGWCKHKNLAVAGALKKVIDDFLDKQRWPK